MGKRDRDKKVRHHTHMWLKRPGNSIATLADAAKLPPDRIIGWLDNDARQLDPTEHSAIMPLVGLRPEDMPEILVHDFRKSGYLPEVLLNFLSLLGWSPGGDRERMTVEDMVRLFSIEHIGHSNAKFNREKLLAFNTEAFAAATPQRLSHALVDFLAVNPQSPLTQLTAPGAPPDAQRIGQLMTMNAGFHVLREVDDKSGFLFLSDDAITYPEAAVKKLLDTNDGRAALTAARAILASIDPWTTHAIEAAIKSHCESTGQKLGAVAQPIRLAISGSTVSPPIFQALEFLGKPHTLNRIDGCLRKRE
jgi:glutamyl-tRNA synthetase